jgi:hypothetical protein
VALAGLPEIEGKTDAEVRHGFKLFFINKHVDALNFFDAHADIPLCALAKAAMFMIWSMLTMDDGDLANTITYIKQVQSFIGAYVAAGCAYVAGVRALQVCVRCRCACVAGVRTQQVCGRSRSRC